MLQHWQKEFRLSQQGCNCIQYPRMCSNRLFCIIFERKPMTDNLSWMRLSGLRSLTCGWSIYHQFDKLDKLLVVQMCRWRRSQFRFLYIASIVICVLGRYFCYNLPWMYKSNNPFHLYNCWLFSPPNRTRILWLLLHQGLLNNI